MTEPIIENDILEQRYTPTRYLSIWERFDTNWKEILSELQVCPNLEGIEVQKENVILELKLNITLLNPKPMGSVVVCNEKNILDYINKWKKDHNVPCLPKVDLTWGKVSKGHYHHDFQVFVKIWMCNYCEYNNKPFKIIEIPEIIPPIENCKQTLKCKLGFHRWEKFEDQPRKSIAHIGQFLQKAMFRCKKCNHRKIMWRRGSLNNIYNKKWMKCTKREESYIDHLPLMEK